MAKYFYTTMILAVLLLFSYKVSHSQQNNIWCFGAYAGFDFNTSPMTPFTTNGLLGVPAASVADEEGQLLFYTNGDEVYNANHELMPGGGQLIIDPILPAVPYGRYISRTGTAGSSVNSWTSYGATVISPVPGSRQRYYIFSLTPAWLAPYDGRLYYSIINMELDNGLGDVEVANKCVLLDSGLISASNISFTESPLEAIRGAHCNIWLLALKQSQQQGSLLCAYNIAATGIAFPISNSLGFAGMTRFCVSPDRTHIAFSYQSKLYNFDPSTGMITSPGLSLSPDLANMYYNTVGFSADGSKLYLGKTSTFQNNGGIDQFDLNASNIPASRFSLGNGSSGNMRLGPDGKLYLSNQTPNSPFLYGTIQSPNESGLTCNFTPNTPFFAPGSGSGSGLPRFVPTIPYDTATSYYSLTTAACMPLTLQPTDTEGWDYLWNDGSTVDSLVVTQEGIYYVQYFTSPCTYQVDTFEVVIDEVPIPWLGEDTIFCYGDAIHLPLIAPESDILEVLWSTGSTERSITVADSGLYWLQVSIGACTESDTITIGRMQCQCYIGLPNAFTPNGDGVNDLFTPLINSDCPGIDGYVFNVYNRFGHRIYSSFKTEEGWDGTDKGRLAEVGTYFFELTFTNRLTGQRHYKQGDITLIR